MVSKEVLAERKACARIAEIIGGHSYDGFKQEDFDKMSPLQAWAYGVQDGNKAAAEAIRNRNKDGQYS